MTSGGVDASFASSAGSVADRVAEILGAFASGDPGRALCLRTIRGPSVEVCIRADRVQPGASLLKLPLVSAVLDAAESGALAPRGPIRRELLGQSRYPSVLAAFSPDHPFELDELCRLCLLASDNVIAEYLLSLVGPLAVTREARRLGAHRTRLEVGFSDPELSAVGLRNVTTARDASRLVEALSTAEERSLLAEALVNGVHRSRIPACLPLDTRVAHKTGTLRGAVNDAGVVFGERTDVVLAFLSQGVSDAAAESMAIARCSAAVWEALGEL